MTNENNYDIASKYQVELNSKFTKQGSSSGSNTKKNILNELKNQPNNNKESE